MWAEVAETSRRAAVIMKTSVTSSTLDGVAVVIPNHMVGERVALYLSRICMMTMAMTLAMILSTTRRMIDAAR